ncbi:MAG: transposase [Cyanobacteriota bacterium]
MPVAYSKDLRMRVIAAGKAKEGSQRQLTERFKVSLSFVQRVIRATVSPGQVESKPRGATVAPKIADAELAALLNLALFCQTGVKP